MCTYIYIDIYLNHVLESICVYKIGTIIIYTCAHTHTHIYIICSCMARTLHTSFLHHHSIMMEAPFRKKSEFGTGCGSKPCTPSEPQG